MWQQLDYNRQGLELNTGKNPGAHSHLGCLTTPNMTTSCYARCVCHLCLHTDVSSIYHPLRHVLTNLVASGTGYLCLGTSFHPLCSLVKRGCPTSFHWRMCWDLLRHHLADLHHCEVDVWVSRVPITPAPCCQWAQLSPNFRLSSKSHRLWAAEEVNGGGSSVGLSAQHLPLSMLWEAPNVVYEGWCSILGGKFWGDEVSDLS